VTTPVATNYPSDDAQNHGTMKQVMENFLACIKESRGGAPPVAVTLAADAFTPANNASTYIMSAQTGSADDLANISPLNVPNGRPLLLKVAAGHTITLKENAGGTGKLKLLQGIDKPISGEMMVEVMYDSATTTFVELDRNFLAAFPQDSGNKFMATPVGGGLGHWLARTIGIADIATPLAQILGIQAASQIALAGDVLTPLATSSGTITIDAQTGSADELRFIDYTNVPEGRPLILRAASGDTITVKHLYAGPTGNQGQIHLREAGDVSLTGIAVLIVQRIGNTFYELVNGGLTSTSGAVAGICQGRLTTTSGDPKARPHGIKNSNSGTYTTLYWAPMDGGQVATYDGSKWVLRTVGQKSINLSAVTTRPLMVWMRHSDNELETTEFVSRVSSATPGTGTNIVLAMANTTNISSGDLVLIADSATGTNYEWCVASSVNPGVSITLDRVKNSYGGVVTVYTNTPVTDYAFQNGVPVKSGDPTRLFLGIVFCDSNKNVVDISNYFNKIRARRTSKLGVDTWTYNAQIWRETNDNNEGVIVLSCTPDIEVRASARVSYTSNAVGPSWGMAGIGVNRRTIFQDAGFEHNIGGSGPKSDSGLTSSSWAETGASSGYSEATYLGRLKRGMSALWQLENNGQATHVITYYGDNGLNGERLLNGMMVEYEY
jgi:hypothetical protein